MTPKDAEVPEFGFFKPEEALHLLPPRQSGRADQTPQALRDGVLRSLRNGVPDLPTRGAREWRTIRELSVLGRSERDVPSCRRPGRIQCGQVAIRLDSSQATYASFLHVPSATVVDVGSDALTTVRMTLGRMSTTPSLAVCLEDFLGGPGQQAN